MACSGRSRRSLPLMHRKSNRVLVANVWSSALAGLLVGISACGGSGGSEATANRRRYPMRRSPSVARQWNDVLLEAIRNDFARPTVHARNLWHVSAAMYDAWAAYDTTASTWLLAVAQTASTANWPVSQRLMTSISPVSFAAYRISHRFANSPGVDDTRR